MNVVDSSGWLELLTDGPNAERFAAPLSEPDRLVVPAISIYEVFRKVLRERGEHEALTVAATMRRGRVVDLDTSLALDAARLGLEHRLPLADSVIYATARRFDATVWTQDEDFDGLPDVRFIAKSPSGRQ